ncbi:hypothetical protein DFJ74DRAFT_710135 [Hyaloraphidium curvatum]|nr:hypothetical protein DFJ74DRAFT_710135 [Hyaloraphidium curvatum]
MPGPPIPDEGDPSLFPYSRPDFARRRAVLRETVAALAARRDHFRALAEANLARWARARGGPDPPRPGPPIVQVTQEDWGVAALRATKEHGARFAVLNMANAYHPGGGYLEGMVAQEENIFRRTDCHLALDASEMVDNGFYTGEMTWLISGGDGEVYLDTEPRICVRGPEDRAAADLGYTWLADDDVFSFYELRSAADDLRGGKAFDPDECRRRIRAQISTLRAKGIRHASLGAFGCGAFMNPAEEVARIYREELTKADHLDVVVFPVFHAGYGPNNYLPFAEVFREPLA